LVEKCNGSGDCRKPPEAAGAMCPSYHVTKNEKDTTRARANALREVLTHSDAVNKFNSKELKEVFDLCLSCKACASECPSNVDIASVKAEFLYQYQKVNGFSKADSFFAKSSTYYKLASKMPVVANWAFRNSVVSKVIKKRAGIASERTLPSISTKRFNKAVQSSTNQLNKQFGSIYLFLDEFHNYLETSIAQDAYELLLGLGYNVTVVDHLDSARALLSKGFLEEAKQHANRNINYLKELVTLETPLIGIEPSAILGFRDEFLRLADDMEAATTLSKHTFMIEEFLASEIKKGNIIATQFTSEAKKIKIHAHCHQKALSNQKVTFDILNLPEHYSPTIIPSGCCGMAGSFGYEEAHYEVSMKIGELKLFPAIRKSAIDTLIAANGTSCRHQIKDGTGRDALHPVTILRRALLQN
jgi:Fe-S oxidoreductase